MKRRVGELVLLGAAIGLLLLGLSWLWPTRDSRTAPLRMTAGDGTGLRHKLALELASEAANAGLQIQVQPTTGSNTAIQAVSRGEIDLALVQGGLTSGLAAGVCQVSAMHIEPLHLLVSEELHPQVSANGLSSLANQRVNLGPIGSGTHALATAVLGFAGLNRKSPTNEHGFEASTFDYAELMAMDVADLPAALFMVSSLPSPVADFLVERRGYRLIPIEFGEAMALEAFLKLGEPSAVGTINNRHLFETIIPAYTYSVGRKEPPQPLKTVGTRLLLVANENVPIEVVAPLLDSLYSSSFAQAEHPPLDARLLDLPPEYPWHPGARYFRHRHKPLITGDVVDYWEKILAISATLVGGTFFVVQWYRRWSQRKRESSFSAYMERVLAIENASIQNELSAQLDLAALIQSQRELAKIKSEAVGKFVAGELTGEGLINGFLALVNDTREGLTRLILHERSRIEERATLEQRDVDKIWIEQTE